MNLATPPTPTQARLLAVLGDGDYHSLAELAACLYDDLGAARNVRAHLSSIRKRLRPAEDIVSVRCCGVTYYRRVAVADFVKTARR